MINNISMKQFPIYPAFECRSGELIWGQLHTMMLGAKNQEFGSSSMEYHDTKKGPQKLDHTGGTILQSEFKYVVAALKGKWIVERFLYGGGGNCAGFVVHHEDYSGKELLERCKIVGISRGQNHDDKNIVYVNRYDWGCNFNGPNVEECLKLVNPDFSYNPHAIHHQVMDLMDSCRLNLVDASEWNSVLRHFAFGMHPDEGTSCQYLKGDHSVGVHLSIENIEYELGWMIFSETSNELIGFVYDPTYSALEGDLNIEQ